MANRVSNFRKVLLTIPFLILFAKLNSLAQLPPSAQVPSAEQGGSSSALALEDLHSLSLENGPLRSFSPIVGVRDQHDDFTRELIQVEWRINDPIYLFVIRPNRIKKPPAILYLYTYPSDIDRFRNDALCSLMVKNGFAAIGFVSALTGHRYHDRPMKEWFISELPESLVCSVHDVQMILNYLDMRGDVDMNRIGMFGEGSGGTIAILASAVDARLRAIDLFAPWGDWPDWLAGSPVVPEEERAQYLKPEFKRQVAPFDPVEWLPRVKASVRLQYADSQWGTPKVARGRIKSAAPQQAKIISYTDSNAAYSSSASLFDWIKEQLSPVVGHASPVQDP